MAIFQFQCQTVYSNIFKFLVNTLISIAILLKALWHLKCGYAELLRKIPNHRLTTGIRFAAQSGGSGSVFARSVAPCGRLFPRKNSATLPSRSVSAWATSYTLTLYAIHPKLNEMINKIVLT